MSITLIYARAANDVIGLDNSIPWHLPEDLARFKELTSGSAVVMGRKTWDSLPERFRPLPGRKNIVVTRNADWQADGVLKAESLEQALADGLKHGETVWVMGGAQIYAQALPLADSIEMTIIDREFKGDAYAPKLGDEWQEAARSSHVSAQGLPYHFVRYVRAQPPL